MSRYMRFMIVAALAGGFLLGLLNITPSKATNYSYTVWAYPGGPTPQLNCGWHTICLPGNPTDGDGLDWSSPTAGTGIYWRSYSSNTQGLSIVGNFLVVDMNSGSCHTVYAELRSLASSTLQSVKYLHTEPYSAGSSYQVNSGLLSASTSQLVGTTTSNDCNLYPNHLHQAYMSYWTRNTFYPTRATCDDDSGCATYGSVWSYYQQQRDWYSTGY